jgi:hypothetical protein
LLLAALIVPSLALAQEVALPEPVAPSSNK